MYSFLIDRPQYDCSKRSQSHANALEVYEEKKEMEKNALFFFKQ